MVSLQGIFDKVPGLPKLDATLVQTGPQSRVPIGPYEIMGKLGAGEFATVFQCRKSSGSEVRAIKMIDKAHLIRATDVRKSIRRVRRIGIEISAMRALTHPNVVQLFEIYHAPAHIHLVMEAGGEDLYSLNERYPDGLPTPAARQIARSLMMWIAHCVECGVSHRDLKPENVLVASIDSDDGGPNCCLTEVKICDFGLSALALERTRKPGSLDVAANEEEERKRWLLSDFAGSPGFFAPELLLSQEYDARGLDIWSLGGILIETCVGGDVFSDMWMPAYDDKVLRSNKSFALALDAMLPTIAALEWSDPDARSFVFALLIVDPHKRPSAARLLHDQYIAGGKPLGAEAVATAPDSDSAPPDGEPADSTLHMPNAPAPLTNGEPTGPTSRAPETPRPNTSGICARNSRGSAQEFETWERSTLKSFDEIVTPLRAPREGGAIANDPAWTKPTLPPLSAGALVSQALESLPSMAETESMAGGA